VFCIIALLGACQKNNDCNNLPANTPLCLNEQINQLKSKPATNPAATVWQYEYNGQTVYYIPPSCCDVMSQLYDNNCNLICNPDGGITGAGDGKCSDFFNKRKNEKLIWKDDRK
jgi:hypothetical protein